MEKSNQKDFVLYNIKKKLGERCLCFIGSKGSRRQDREKRKEDKEKRLFFF